LATAPLNSPARIGLTRGVNSYDGIDALKGLSAGVDELMEGSGIVIHLPAAVAVRKILADPGAITVNVDGTHTILNAGLKYARRTFIASTWEVYGKDNSGKLCEASIPSSAGDGKPVAVRDRKEAGRVLAPGSLPASRLARDRHELLRYRLASADGNVRDGVA